MKNELDTFTREKMSKKTLAKKVGITENYVFRLCSGERTPSYKLAIKINKITSIPVEVLLGLKK